MSFEWKQILDVARLLEQSARQPGPGGQPFGEAAWRGAVSRAYYALHGHAREYARANLNFQPVGDGSDHGRLIEHFKKRPRFMHVALALSQLKVRRTDCDYDSKTLDAEPMARRAIDLAQQKIGHLS